MGFSAAITADPGRSRMARPPAAFILVFLAFALPVAAADRQMTIQVSPAAEFRAARAERAPTIDGDLSDPAWSNSPDISGFTQRDPDEGKPATELTTVRIAYDDEAIYFGAHLADSQPVTSRLGRRDTSLESDWFRVYLDPHDDHQTGAAFWVNPANVQLDTILFNDNWDDPSWDAVWESATRVGDNGWTVEMKIPYSQLRFPDRTQHTWGLNFSRRLSRRNEESRLVHIPKNESGFVSRFAHLTGIEGIKPKRAFELLPYAVSRADLSTSIDGADPYNSDAEYAGDLGLDLKYQLNSNLTLTGTLNPDFGQVEVDPAVLNLTEFELFFPEKRPFFVEGSSLFEFGKGGSNNNFNFNFFPPSFFYSRRIGRNPQGFANNRINDVSYDYWDVPDQTTILGAAKVTGKTASGWTIAALDALTAAETASFAIDGQHDTDVVEPRSNYLVSRTARNFGEKGRVGMLFTSVNRDLPSELTYLRENAYSGGVDGFWSFGKRDVILEWFLGGTMVDGSAEAIRRTQRSSARYYQRPDADHVELDETRTSLSGWGSRLTLAKQTGKYKYNVQVQSFSPGFEVNDVGFMQRSDATNAHAVLLYNNPEPWKGTRVRSYWAGTYRTYNFDGDLIGAGTMGDGFLEFRNFNYVCYWGGINERSIDDRVTRGGPAIQRPSSHWVGGCLGSNPSRKVSGELWGEFARNEKGGYGDVIGATFTYRPTSKLSVRLDPRYNRNEAIQQWVDTIPDPLATHTYGSRYLFGKIRQNTFEVGTRVEWTFTSRLSLQLYLQPFIATGDYHSFKEVARARSLDFIEYGRDAGTISFNEDENVYTVDPDGDGSASSFTFDNPDFNLRSIRANAILRWEFRPGSALYVVWNENRAEEVPIGDFRFNRDLQGAVKADSEDVLLVKMAYYIGM
jgi:hypothetical protein